MKINFGERVLEKDAPLSVFEAASELELASRATLCAVVNGEVNGDQYVDALDAALLLKLDAGLATLDAKGLISGDVNNDGYVDALDAAMILKYDAGIIEKL